MRAFLRQHHGWIWLLCIALLVVRSGGAHWHLCFDGSEPPLSVHSGHIALDEGGSVEHSDVDLNIVDDATGKNLGKTLDIPALLSLAVLIWLWRQWRPSAPADYRSPVLPRFRRRLAPIPRAPPR